MVQDSIFKETEDRMKKALEALKREFSAVRTGRASPALLDRIQVEAYGQAMPIKQVANVSVPEARVLIIQPWDKAMLGPLEKAIQKSDLGINPTNDGTVVRLVIPALTEERRKDLVKQVRKKAEEGKVALRNIRRDAMEELKKEEKDKRATEDEVKKAQDKVQKLTDSYIKEFDSTLAAKEKEIMEI